MVECSFNFNIESSPTEIINNVKLKIENEVIPVGNTGLSLRRLRDESFIKFCVSILDLLSII